MSIDQQERLYSESDRLEVVAEWEANEGPDRKDDYSPGTFGCHELLDRVHLVSSILQLQVVDHPACFQNPEWYRLAGAAVEALEQLYQEVGAAHLGDDADQ